MRRSGKPLLRIGDSRFAMLSGAMVVSFVFFLLCFLGIGLYSATRRQPTAEDYLLAGRQISPWMTALSAVSTNNSGFMFIGLIGAAYASGISSMWIMVGWISGDFLAWLWIHRRLRERTEEVGSNSITSFLGHAPQGRHQSIVLLAAVVTLVFLGTYAAAQLQAGSKALHVLFGWEYAVGTLLGAVIVIIYCFAGGIRASIWTDTAQAMVMFFAMYLLLAVALLEIGGVSALWSKLEAIDAGLVDWRPPDLRFGFAAYLVGWITAGIGVVGQPHIMVRAMAIDSAAHIRKARRVYFLWYSSFSAAAVIVGVSCRVLLPVTEGFDRELALPHLSQMLLPEILVGFVLAGLFAATISTADSQILSCSAALTQDLFPRWGASYRNTKLGTLIVTAGAVTIVAAGNESVFDLVVLSWSALASTLGPLVAVKTLGRPVSERLGLAMMVAALAAMLFWRFGLGFDASLYEVFPGMLTGFLVYGVVQCWPGSR